jgi:peptide deformylase
MSAASGTYRRAPRATILRHPDPVLACRASQVDPLDGAIVSLGHALVTTMRASPACVGLAAPQIGQAIRLFCMDVTGHRQARSCAGLVVLANPIIVARSDRLLLRREGCMSVPDLTGNVKRAAEVEVEGVEPGTGRVVRITADGIEARCLQHEIDHLDGLVFVDRVNDAGTDLFPRKKYA